MLGYYGMSLQGNSHIANRIECQDAHAVKRVEKWIVAAIADGLGSAKHSATGAKTAVDTLVRFVEENLPERWNEKDLGAALRLAYGAALRAVKKIAEEQKQDIKEYDTTLTAVIYNGVNVVYGHVGDGGVVTLSKYGDFSILTTAQKGEEHNMTVPLRMGGEYWNFGTSRDSVCALFMMTDGVFDVACPVQLAKREPPIYVKFVRSFMDVNILPVKTQKDFDEAQSEIKAFFTGKETNDITDDKTVVGIINTDEKPEVKPDAYYAEPDWEGIKKIQDDGLYSPPPPPPPPDKKGEKPAGPGTQTGDKPPLRPTPMDPDPKPLVPPVKTGRSSTGYEQGNQDRSTGRNVDIEAAGRRKRWIIISLLMALLIVVVALAFLLFPRKEPQSVKAESEPPVEITAPAQDMPVIDWTVESDKLDHAYDNFEKVFMPPDKKDDDTIQVKYVKLYKRATTKYIDGREAALESNADKVRKAVTEIENITTELKTEMEKDKQLGASGTPATGDGSAIDKGKT